MVATDVGKAILGTYLFGKETSYATGGTANKDMGLIQSFNVNPDSTASERHGQGQANAVYAKGGIVTPKGSVEIELQHGRPIEWAIYGGTTTHVATSTDEVHTFVFANTLPSLAWEASYEVGATDLVQKGTGLVFGNTTLSLNIDGMLKLRSDWVAKTIDNSATSVTAAVVNTGAPLAGFEGTLSIGGTAVDYVQSWELTVNRNSKVIHGQGSRAPVYGASHLANVSWKATIGFSNTTQINRLLGSAAAITATEPASFSTIFSATNGVTLGSGKRELSITLTGCQLKDYNVNAQLGDFVMYDISGIGLLGAGTMTDQVLAAAW